MEEGAVMTLIEPGKVFVGVSGKPEYVHLPFGNRHGLITGATGTGKTVSLQILAEGFSTAGVPVFCADVKGDVAGLAMAGEPKDFLAKRAETIGFTAEYRFESFPVMFWDLFGKQGHPIRATVSEMGPLLLARLLGLNDTQEGVLTIAFKIADEDGLLLLDLKDLQALLAYVADRASELTTRYGNVSKASVGAVQRSLLMLEQQGGESFFGEPALRITDLIRTSTDGRGIINILAADTLMQSPRLYATFLLWLLSELFDELPEVGDRDQPKLVFFFDEAHLLFNDAPKALLEKIELVVRLVRSKGVGVYFVSQNPLDVPDIVLAQIGNRVQHALRAFTPRDTKAVKAAADTFRANPDFSTFDVITQLGTGEALVSTLEEKGVPSVVQRTLVRPPSSRIGVLTPEERAVVIAASPVAGVYDQTVDRESAFEILKKKVEKRQPGDAPPGEAGGQAGQAESGGLGGMLDGIFGTGSSRSRRLTPAQRAAREATRTAAGELGKAIGGASGGRILRSVLGGILGR